MKNYDVIIVGAGSVGLPLAHRLAVKGVSVGVIDELLPQAKDRTRLPLGVSGPPTPIGPRSRSALPPWSSSGA